MWQFEHLKPHVTEIRLHMGPWQCTYELVWPTGRTESRVRERIGPSLAPSGASSFDMLRISLEWYARQRDTRRVV